MEAFSLRVYARIELLAVFAVVGVFWLFDAVRHELLEPYFPLWADSTLTMVFVTVGAFVFARILFGMVEKANERLEKERQRLDSVFRYTTDAILVLDQTLRITAWNKAAERITGWSASEVVGKLACSDVLKCHDRHGRPLDPGSWAPQVLQSREPINYFELAVTAKDGTQIPVTASCSPVPSRERDGNATDLVIVMRDVSERVRLEGELEALHKIRLGTASASDVRQLAELVVEKAKQLVEAESALLILEMPGRRGDVARAFANFGLDGDPADDTMLVLSGFSTMDPAIKAARLENARLGLKGLDEKGMVDAEIMDARELVAVAGTAGAGSGVKPAGVGTGARIGVRSGGDVDGTVSDAIAPDVSIPLVIGGRPAGLLEVWGPGLKKRYALVAGPLQRLADQAAMAIENREFYNRIQELGALEERYRLAREMHDGLAQSLGYLNLKLAILTQKIAREPEKSLAEETSHLRQVVSDLYDEVRRSIYDLKMPVDAHSDFITLLETYVKNLAHGTFSISLQVDPGLAPQWPVGVQAHLLRIVQEALTNVRKHAQASSVCISLKREAAMVRISVEDDGAGFAVEETGRDAEDAGGRHFGLTTMQERASLIGGRFEVHSQPGRGTVVSILVPEGREWSQ